MQANTPNVTCTTNWLYRLWNYRLTPWLCFGFAALLLLPMTKLGLSLDDYLHYDVLAGGKLLPYSDSWIFHLFTFFDGDIDRTRFMAERIALPWWTDDEVKINFFRPLSAISLWLDYQLWPESIALKHLHSIGWYILLLSAVYVLFSKIFEQRALALFATFIYAIDFSHFLNVSWIAGRNALIAVFFGALTIAFYHHYRSHQKSLAGLLAILCFIVGLFSGEMAIGTGAYLVSYALFLDRGSLAKRILLLVPFGLIFLLWWYNYKALGFGSSNSGFYLDPANHPLEFFTALLYRIPTLLFTEWSGISTLAFLRTLPEETKIVFGFTLVFLLIITWLLWPLVKTNATARFWLLGSTLAIIPSASTIPHERVLLFVDIGGAALLAQLLFFCWSGKVSFRQTQAAKSIALAVLFFMHIVLQLFIYILASYTISTTNQSDTLRLSTELPFDDIQSDQHLIYVNQPNTFFFGNLILARSYYRLDNASNNYMLGSRHGLMELLRVDANTLRINMPLGVIPEIFNGNLALIFRRLENALQPGDTFQRGNCTFTVETVTSYAGFPKQFLFSCQGSLNHPRYRWLIFEDNQTKSWSPPAIGDSITLNKKQTD